VRLTSSGKSRAPRWVCEKGPDHLISGTRDLLLSQVVIMGRTLCNRTPGGLGQHPAELRQLGLPTNDFAYTGHEVFIKGSGRIRVISLIPGADPTG
jgi:hypothetical protein